MSEEDENEGVHALIQRNLAHDMHAGVHDPDENHRTVSLGGTGTTHLDLQESICSATRSLEL
jgi:hypothetical protein